MKKTGYLVMLLILCILLSGCSRTDPSDASWRTVNDAGVLKVGMYDDCFPMCSPKGAKFYGYDADLMAGIAERLGVKVVYVDILESGKTAAQLMAEGAIDCAMGGVAYSSALEMEYLLSEPYLSDNHVIVLPEDSSVSRLSDISGRSVSYVQGSLSHRALRSAPLLYDSIGPITLATSEVGTLLDLQEGTAEIAFTRQSVTNYFLANHGGVKLMLNENGTTEVLGTMEYVMLFPLGSKALADKVNSAYTTMKRDQVTDELYNTWFVNKQPVSTAAQQLPEETSLMNE